MCGLIDGRDSSLKFMQAKNEVYTDSPVLIPFLTLLQVNQERGKRKRVDGLLALTLL